MRLIKWWNHFWFESVDLNPIVAARTGLGLTLFVSYLYRFKNISFWGENAFLSQDRSLLMLQESIRPIFNWSFWPDHWVMGIQIAFCLGLFLWAFGVGGRILGVSVWILHMGFIYRNYAMIFGADVIAAVFLFYFSLIRTPHAMKNFALVRNFKNLSWSKELADPLSSCMVRLIQVHLAVIYSYTGFEKLRGMSWWDGTALWSVLANSQMVWIDLTWLKHVSWVFPLMGFLTIIFEVYFPLAMLTRFRMKWLCAGVIFHLGIAYLMSLWTFSLVMLSLYFVYLDWPSDGFKFKKMSQFKTS